MVDILFLDANVLFSAAYRSAAGLRRLWSLPNVRLVTSAYALEEARRNLPDPQRQADLKELVRQVEITDKTTSLRPADLPSPGLPGKDVPILGAAIAAGASHLLTGDFRHFGPIYGQTIHGVRILPPAEYLRGHLPAS